MIRLQLAKPDQSALCMELLNQARTYLHSYGNYQWDETYPTLPIIEKDLANRVGYLIYDDETPIGYFCGDFDGDASYDELQGTWLSDQPYIVVHRLGLGDTGRGKGMAANICQCIEDMAREQGVHSFRIDTDRRNLKMQHLMHKCGFTFCGYVTFAGDNKLAYEKLI